MTIWQFFWNFVIAKCEHDFLFHSFSTIVVFYNANYSKIRQNWIIKVRSLRVIELLTKHIEFRVGIILLATSKSQQDLSWWVSFGVIIAFRVDEFTLILWGQRSQKLDICWHCLFWPIRKEAGKFKQGTKNVRQGLSKVFVFFTYSTWSFRSSKLLYLILKPICFIVCLWIMGNIIISRFSIF